MGGMQNFGMKKLWGFDNEITKLRMFPICFGVYSLGARV
jgi:hypothetical protein